MIFAVDIGFKLGGGEISLISDWILVLGFVSLFLKNLGKRLSTDLANRKIRLQ
jgi:hypothetical protein